MKKLKAFWLRRSIATRLTALFAVFLVLGGLFWLWPMCKLAERYHAENQFYLTDTANDYTAAKLQEALGYTPQALPSPGTEAYWQLRSALFYDYWGELTALTYYDPVSSENIYFPPRILVDATLADSPAIDVDIGLFPTEDIIAICQDLTEPNTTADARLTAYGMQIGNNFFPNRIVHADGRVFQSTIPVPEESTCIPTSTVGIKYDDLEALAFALDTLRHYGPMNTPSEQPISPPRGIDYAANYQDIRLTAETGYQIATIRTYSLSACVWQSVRVPVLLLIVLLVLSLWLLHRQIRRTVTQPLWETTRQAQLVSTLQFDEFCPDTARGDEIGDLNRALADMAGDLHQRWDSERDLEDRRQQFVAAASHDLKTPLALIGGYAEAIAQDISPEENARYLAAIEQETTRMNSLVREMLDYTRLDRTDELEHRTTIDLAALLRSMLEEYAPLFERRRLTVTLADSVRIRGDETLLRRAFGCLLENAAKYSPEGGRVAVVLRRSGRPLLTVENECDPIPESELPRLFEMFYRGDKARDRAGGHGLGLAITQKILALHGLSCRAENTETGVRFVVTRR
nr:HAMP domain-containing sensor histidine kinase [uncultured Agathobaculum sp.]